MSTRRMLRVLLLLALGCGDGGDDEQPPPPPPLGSAVITWVLQDQSGNPLTCDQLALSDAEVSLGRETMTVACGDEQRVRFEMLTPGRYGVTIRLNAVGRGQLLSQTDNVEVVASQEAQLEIVVEIDRGSVDLGSVLFRWTVAGGDAAANCGAFDAAVVRIATTAGSIAQFTHEQRCADGEAVIEELTPGVYEVRAQLVDTNGTVIPESARSASVRVRERERAQHSFAFFQLPGMPASFHGIWTITGSTAADACGDVGGDFVRVSLRTGVEIKTATAACDAGSLTIGDLFGGPGQIRATFVLFSDVLGALDTRTSTAFTLTAGRTSTVATDFQIDP